MTLDPVLIGLGIAFAGPCRPAKYWLRVLAEVKNCGTHGVLMIVCDGLKALPDAIGQV